MKKFVLLLIVFLAIGAGVVVGKSFQQPAISPAQKQAIVQPPAITPTPIPLAKPVTLSIPKLSVIANVEYVGNDAKGNMDVPKNDMHVAWYQPGFLPGANGNAVLAGHYDTKAGGQAVFYRLGELQTGDDVIVTDEKGTQLTFRVVSKDTYPVDTFPIKTVFGESDKKYLNLVTCGGVWDATRKIYADRIVVRTQLQMTNEQPLGR